MSNINNGNNPSSDFTRKYKFDGGGTSETGSNNATITNGTYVKAEIGYQLQQLVWGATTTCTYPSVTYTNSYIWIKSSGIWTFTKNSTTVTATTLSGVNGNNYALLSFYNRTLSEGEEQVLKLEGLRKLGPSNLANYPNLFNGLVFYADMKGTAHNLVDGVNGTVTGATLTTDRFGNINSAYSFDGVNNYISTLNGPQNFGTGDFSISVIVSKNSGGTYKTIWSNLTPSSVTGIAIYFNIANNIVFECWSAGTVSNLITVATYDLFTNYNITCIRAGTYHSIYVNGTLVGSGSLGIKNVTNAVTGAFGMYTFNSSSFFNGKIENAIMFNRALSTNEVLLMYNLTSKDYIYPTKKYDLPNLRNGLTQEWSGNNDGLTTYYDTSGNLLNATGTSITNGRIGKIKTMGFNGSNSIIIGTNYVDTFSSNKVYSISLYINFNSSHLDAFYDGVFGNGLSASISNSAVSILGHHGSYPTYMAFARGNGTINNLLELDIIDLNKWMHIVMVYDGTNIIIYKNGILVGSMVSTLSAISESRRNIIGNYSTASNAAEYFGGEIGLVKIYNRVLSSKEIGQLYYQEKTNFIY